jgi:hypothetical protein
MSADVKVFRATEAHSSLDATNVKHNTKNLSIDEKENTLLE